MNVEKKIYNPPLDIIEEEASMEISFLNWFKKNPMHAGILLKFNYQYYYHISPS